MLKYYVKWDKLLIKPTICITSLPMQRSVCFNITTITCLIYDTRDINSKQIRAASLTSYYFPTTEILKHLLFLYNAQMLIYFV